MDSTPSDNETVVALKSLRDKCAVDLHKLEQQAKGVEAKIASMTVKLEALNEAVATASKVADHPKKTSSPPS